MSKVDVKLQRTDGKLVVSLAGAIDEDVDFSPYILSGNKDIELELGGLKSINSCGIREWIKWLGTTGGATIAFENCPKVIVDQINMVEGFLPANGRVKSFFVPYYNEESGDEKNVLFRYGIEFSEKGLTPPEHPKDSDGNEMEMDVVEAKYFKFLKK